MLSGLLIYVPLKLLLNGTYIPNISKRKKTGKFNMYLCLLRIGQILCIYTW